MPPFSTGVLPCDHLLVDGDGVLGRILLNRPRALNALTTDMVRSLSAQLEAWADDEAVSAVTIEGAGDRGLCAGGDVRAVREAALEGGADPLEFWQEEYALDAAIAAYPKLVVAAMDGIVLGGGVGISAYAGLRLVTERSTIAMPETGIGFFPDVGALHLLSRAPGELGTYMALTGESVTGADAIAVGLADAQVPAADVPGLIARLARGDRLDASVGDAAPPSRLAAHRGWIDACFVGDDAAAIIERLRARPEREAGEAADLLEHRSPLSVAVTLEALRRAAHLSLDEVLTQDLALGAGFLDGSDFAEGVRAQLVDKDRRPRWQHAHVSQVPRERVLAMFDCVADSR